MMDHSSQRAPDDGQQVVVMNPQSGTGDHGSQVRILADEHGFDVVETSEAGEAIEAAARLAPDASLVAACGGDGTVNEVVRGLRRADALGETTLGIVPAGTGNNFAGNVDVTSISQSFDVMATGERRCIDVGLVSGIDGDKAHEDADSDDEFPTGDEEVRPFVNSCVCGITAEASSSTAPEQKGRLGTLAYVVNTLRELGEFEPISLAVRISRDVAETWAGEAVAVLVGNGRRFTAEGATQANMEDGRFEVTIIEAVPALDLVGEEARRLLLSADADHITRLRTPSLELSVDSPETPSFSLDGEILASRDVLLDTEQQSLRLCVGEGYEPNPDGSDGDDDSTAG